VKSVTIILAPADPVKVHAPVTMPLIWGKGTEIARQFAVRHCMAGLHSSLSRAEEAVRRADQGARKPIAPELRPPSSTFPQAGERPGRAMSAGA